MGQGSLSADLERQRDFLGERAPAYAELLAGLQELLPEGVAGDLATLWSGRKFGAAFYERPLLILAALRFDALCTGPSHPLYMPVVEGQRLSAQAMMSGLRETLRPTNLRLRQQLRHGYVQTNAVSRALTWLWPLALAQAARPVGVVDLFDIGASAGLNLVADQLHATGLLGWVDGDGQTLECGPLPAIRGRHGFELRPLDPRDVEQATWLRACIWPGQTLRERRLAAAIEQWTRAWPEGEGPVLQQCCASEAPAMLLRDGGTRRLCYQTVMREYLSDDHRTQYVQGMRSWLMACAAGEALWLEFEICGDDSAAAPMAVTVHWRDGQAIRTSILAYAEPHPKTLHLVPAAIAEFQASLRREG